MKVNDIQVEEFNRQAVKTGLCILLGYAAYAAAIVAKPAVVFECEAALAGVAVVLAVVGWVAFAALCRCKDREYCFPEVDFEAGSEVMSKLSAQADRLYHAEPWVADLVKVVDPESAAIFEIPAGEDGEGALVRACRAEKKRQAAIASGSSLFLTLLSLLDLLLVVRMFMIPHS